MHLLFLLFTSIPIARADWNLDPQAANNIPSPQLSVLATNNELPENPILDPTLTGVKRVEDNSVTASDQSQRNSDSDQIDAMIPEGPPIAEGESCLPNNGRSSRKMRVRRDQGICEWNPPQQFREEGSQPPNTEQQNKPQGQVTGSKKPPGGGKKRRTSITVFRVTAKDKATAERWFPKEDRPQSDTIRCRTPGFDIPVCAEFVDSVEMFPAVMGLGPICILAPATPCTFLLQSLQLTPKKKFRYSYMMFVNHLQCLVWTWKLNGVANS